MHTHNIRLRTLPGTRSASNTNAPPSLASFAVHIRERSPAAGMSGPQLHHARAEIDAGAEPLDFIAAALAAWWRKMYRRVNSTATESGVALARARRPRC